MSLTFNWAKACGSYNLGISWFLSPPWGGLPDQTTPSAAYSYGPFSLIRLCPYLMVSSPKRKWPQFQPLGIAGQPWPKFPEVHQKSEQPMALCTAPCLAVGPATPCSAHQQLLLPLQACLCVVPSFGYQKPTFGIVSYGAVSQPTSGTAGTLHALKEGAKLRN